MNNIHMYHLCKQNIGKFAAVQTVNNEQIHGYIEDVDDHNVYMAVPDYNNGCNNEMPQVNPMHNVNHSYNQAPQGHCNGYNDHDRQFYGLGGYPGYGGYPGGWYGPRPRPGFRRLILPLAALTALSTLPFFY